MSTRIRRAAAAAVGWERPPPIAAGVLADSHRIPVGNQPFEVATAVCGVPVHVGIIDDNEYGQFKAQGPVFGIVSPAAQATGLPGIWLSQGAVTGTFDSTFATTSLTVAGRLTDGCALIG
jgi:hypothetical protein